MFCTVLSTVMVFIPLRVYAYVSLVRLGRIEAEVRLFINKTEATSFFFAARISQGL